MRNPTHACVRQVSVCRGCAHKVAHEGGREKHNVTMAIYSKYMAAGWSADVSVASPIRADELHKVDRRREDGDALPNDDLRALHRRDGPGGSHGKEGLGPIPEVGQCGR